MNEQSPERYPYKPKPGFETAVMDTMDFLFEVIETEAVSDEATPSGNVARYWMSEGNMFMALRRYNDPLATDPKDKYSKELNLVRISPTDIEQTMATRIYFFQSDTGELEVVNTLVSIAEMEKFDPRSPSGIRFANALDEGREMQLFVPSEVDYLDFLTDVDSAYSSLKI